MILSVYHILDYRLEPIMLLKLAIMLLQHYAYYMLKIMLGNYNYAWV